MTIPKAAGLAPPVLSVFDRLRWLDGRPLLDVIEPYRRRFFTRFFDERDAEGRLRYNLALAGRAKKNWKTADLGLGALFCLVTDTSAAYDSECYILANDGDQARDDLALVKKLVQANGALLDWLTIRRDLIERKDGRGFLAILPAGDVIGSHGKSYRFVGYDEIHGLRSWDLLEAMQPDPHRLDAQQWITSYASIIHRPGVPLFDLLQRGKAETDSRMLFSWYGADFTTDANFVSTTPEERANPSRGSWADPEYLTQQARRLYERFLSPSPAPRDTATPTRISLRSPPRSTVCWLCLSRGDSPSPCPDAPIGWRS